MKKTILVTGGNGFIGKKLTDALLQAGYKVKVVSRRAPTKQPANPDISVVQADYQNVDSLINAMKGCSGVFHLAAAIFGFKFEDFERANTLATQNMVKAANQTEGLERFVYVSSLAASGYADSADHPRTEADIPNPCSDYGITKLGGEKAVKTLKESISWTIVRPPIVYGRNDSGVSKIASWVRRGLMVNTSGKGLFSFVYVEDLVKALVMLTHLQGTNKETFFISEEATYLWPVFIEKMASAMDVRKPFMPNAPLWLLKLAASIYSLTARLSGAQPALNYDKVKEAVIDGHWICSSQKWRQLSKQEFTSLDEGLKKSF